MALTQSLRPAGESMRASRSPRPVKDQVVVVVGASSGIGRETSLRLAAKGAQVVLAARNQQTLDDVAAEIADKGGEATTIPVDVAEPHQLDRLAEQAMDWRGRIDTWINDAAVSEYATFEEMTTDEIERIVRVNLLGTIHGCRAILPHMRRQGFGTIMNVGSVVSTRAVPLQSIYSATKYGIRGFTEALRMELDHEQSGIHVTLIMPPSTNTPFFNHARSKMGVKPQPIPPIYDVGIVADAIVYAAGHPRRDVLIGGASKMLELMQRISPALTDRWMLQGGRAFKNQQTNEADEHQDTLFKPASTTSRSHGDFSDRAKHVSLYTPLELRPAVKAAVCAGMAATVGLAAIWLLGSRERHDRTSTQW